MFEFYVNKFDVVKFVVDVKEGLFVFMKELKLIGY